MKMKIFRPSLQKFDWIEQNWIKRGYKKKLIDTKKINAKIAKESLIVERLSWTKFDRIKWG